jgi:hypothetical protein
LPSAEYAPKKGVPWSVVVARAVSKRRAAVSNAMKRPRPPAEALGGEQPTHTVLPSGAAVTA